MFGNVGLTISQEDVKAIMGDNGCIQTDYLNIEEFYAKLSCWKQKTFSAVAPVKVNHDNDKNLEKEIKKLKE